MEALRTKCSAVRAELICHVQTRIF